jgi:hypothetical protein
MGFHLYKTLSLNNNNDKHLSLTSKKASKVVP